jgi:F-type H+-transporting ATPase subunit b
MNRILTTLTTLIFSASALAAGGGGGAHHEPSIFDLKYPVLNFGLLVIFMVWKLKGPVVKMFQDKADDVLALYNHAEEKDKEAQVELDKAADKVKNVEKECASIIEDAHNDSAAFDKSHSEEIVANIARLERDGELKVKAEKEDMIKGIEAELVEQVIASTKKAISSNKDMQLKATNKLIAEI